MIFTPTTLNGSYLIDLEERHDERGFFARYFCEDEFGSHQLNTRWVQINNSLTKQVGTVRGLHFQYQPNAEVKLVRCIRGAIWDVIVDLRDSSPTFGMWFGAELNAHNRTAMYIPTGFAHGFLTLQPNSEILYLVSNVYSPDSEGTLLWSDVNVGIEWPIAVTLISEKDMLGKSLAQIEPVKL